MSQDNWERLNKETSRIMDERLALFKKDLELSLKELTKIPEAKPSGSSKEHKSKKEEIDCPECYKELRPLFYAKEAFKDKKYACEDCGVPVDENEEECPSCRGKNAKPRR